MKDFRYVRADTLDRALELGGTAGAGYLAGGTTQIDLQRAEVLQPELLVDITRLPLTDVELTDDGGLWLGALARMSDVAADGQVRSTFPLLAEALEKGASAQLRNMASMGGNMMQRTRCSYFRDPRSRCNKRAPGTGCDAVDGVNRGMAVLGTSEACIATHPSDAAVALVALDAVIVLQDLRGERRVALDDFFLLPGDTPDREHPIEAGELITAIEIPPLTAARNSLYLKVRDRESYEFALASAAVAVEWRGDVVADVRLAMGGVGTKPWRCRTAEELLRGQPASVDAFGRAADAEFADARGAGRNDFKIELGRATMVRALATLAARSER